MLFGVVVDAEAIKACDQVLDCLEQAGVEEDDWDWLVWHRRGRTYLLLHAPMLVRSALVDADLTVRPLNMVAEGMQDNRNTWVEPSSARRRSAPQVAADRLQRWQDQQWAEEKGAEPEAAKTGSGSVSLEGRDSHAPKPTGPVTRTPGRGARPGSTIPAAAEQRTAPKLSSPSKELLAAFGVLDTKDSEGGSYTIGFLADDPEDDAEEAPSPVTTPPWEDEPVEGDLDDEVDEDDFDEEDYEDLPQGA